ncbi:adenylyltransferase/cytidyltransferase family protein [Candidatus Woesearchaeota archaeon]|nr:adenylyltransferase/cytidyltransferase family protein [Candidatus Woesearchaeota archaeon]
MAARKKIVSRDAVPKICNELRAKGKKIVTCNGSFDLMHIGHITFLQEAKARGDALIVGVNSNSSVKQYKSKDKPIIDEKHRMESLAALECVDYVVLMDEKEIAVPLINLARPDVHANGEEYGKDCVEAKAIKAIGGKLYLVKKVPGFSTTELIDRITQIYCRKK